VLADLFTVIKIPNSWRVPDFVKFSGDDARTTWEHISQYIAQLGVASFSDALKVRLFSLSLSGTGFSWFSSLAPSSIYAWNQLEQNFHGHIYSRDNEAKLTDLTSVKQGIDECVLDYFKRYKDTKNHCFSLSISEKDLANLAFGGLRSHLREKPEGFDFLSINQVHVRALGQEYKFKNAKESHKTHLSNVHIVDCESDISDDEEKDVYVAEFVWPSKANSVGTSGQGYLLLGCPGPPRGARPEPVSWDLGPGPPPSSYRFGAPVCPQGQGRSQMALHAPGPLGRSGAAAWRPVLRRPGPPGRSGFAPTGLGGPAPLFSGKGSGAATCLLLLLGGRRMALPLAHGRWPLTGAPAQLPH
jgi:hypothetical protein